MKATPTLLICAVLSGCFPPLLHATPSTPDPNQRGYELLELSTNQLYTDQPLATRTANEALALFQSVNNATGIATSYEQLGRCYFAQAEMAESARYYDLALQIYL